MTPIEVAQQIEKKINLLKENRKQIKGLAQRKAQSIANYERRLAITIVKLRTDQGIVFEGFTLNNIPTTTVEKVARGICWESKLELEEAEGMYKGLITTIESIKAELNAWQSINRYLDSV